MRGRVGIKWNDDEDAAAAAAAAADCLFDHTPANGIGAAPEPECVRKRGRERRNEKAIGDATYRAGKTKRGWTQKRADRRGGRAVDNIYVCIYIYVYVYVYI